MRRWRLPRDSRSAKPDALDWGPQSVRCRIVRCNARAPIRRTCRWRHCRHPGPPPQMEKENCRAPNRRSCQPRTPAARLISSCRSHLAGRRQPPMLTLPHNRRGRFPSRRIREEAGRSLSLSPMRPHREPVRVPTRPCRPERWFNEAPSPSLPRKVRGTLRFRFTRNHDPPRHGRRKIPMSPPLHGQRGISVDPPPRAQTEISVGPHPQGVMAISVDPRPQAEPEISVRPCWQGGWEPYCRWLHSLGRGRGGRLRRFNARRKPRPPTSSRRHPHQTKASGRRQRTGRRRARRAKRRFGGNSPRSHRDGGTVRPVRPRTQRLVGASNVSPKRQPHQ
jgi:hypothetical protein